MRIMETSAVLFQSARQERRKRHCSISPDPSTAAVHGPEPLPLTRSTQCGHVQDHGPVCDRSITEHLRFKTTWRPLITTVLRDRLHFLHLWTPHIFTGKNPSPIQKGKSYCLKKGFLQIFNKGARIFLTNFYPQYNLHKSALKCR